MEIEDNFLNNNFQIDNHNFESFENSNYDNEFDINGNNGIINFELVDNEKNKDKIIIYKNILI